MGGCRDAYAPARSPARHGSVQWEGGTMNHGNGMKQDAHALRMWDEYIAGVKWRDGPTAVATRHSTAKK